MQLKWQKSGTCIYAQNMLTRDDLREKIVHGNIIKIWIFLDHTSITLY